MILLGGFAVLFIINLASLYLDRSPSHKHMPGLYVLENPLHYGYEYDSLWVYEDGSFKESQKVIKNLLYGNHQGFGSGVGIWISLSMPYLRMNQNLKHLVYIQNYCEKRCFVCLKKRVKTIYSVFQDLV